MRFPEFTGEWAPYKLKYVIRLQGGYAFQSEKFQYSGIPIIRISNLPQSSNMVDLSDCVYYEDGEYDNYIVKNGDLLIAMSGATTGKTAIYRNNIKAYLNQRVGLFRIKSQKLFYPFLYSFIESKIFIGQLNAKLVAGAQPNISSKDIEEIRLFLPTTLEQQRIANLFTLIDERIATQIKIIDKLQSLMSGIKAKLLSPTFLEESIKLSELGKLKNGYAFKSSTYVPNGQYNIITIANVSGERFITGECNQIDDLPDDIHKHQILSDDDILISLTGNVGRVSLNRGTNNLLNQRVGLFQLYSNELQEFVYQSISAQTFETSMRLKAQGAAQMNIGKNDIEDYEIPYTTNKLLLKKISNILQYIEERIILAKVLNAQYKYQKLYLLQQMFI